MRLFEFKIGLHFGTFFIKILFTYVNLQTAEKSNEVNDDEKIPEETSIETDEAKKIVESITDSITSGEKQECESTTTLTSN